MVPGRDTPSRKGRPSASIFQRLGLVVRRRQATQDTQPDYRQRWPTVTTLVEQRSESRLPAAYDDQAPKSAKVKALEAAAVPVQWLQCRLESVQDRLDIKIDDAQAKGTRRPSTAPEAGGRASPKPRKPGQSTHPYDTDVAPHPAADDGDGRATTVRRFETHIFADPQPEPRKTWRLRLASLTKTSKVVRSDTARSSEEALVPGSGSGSPPTSPERTCKCAEEGRPTAYAGEPPSQPLQAAVGVPIVREPAELLSASAAKSPPSSVSKRAKAKGNKAESRTPLSNAPRTPDPQLRDGRVFHFTHRPRAHSRTAGCLVPRPICCTCSRADLRRQAATRVVQQQAELRWKARRSFPHAQVQKQRPVCV